MTGAAASSLVSLLMYPFSISMSIVFVWDFPHFVRASDIYLFICLCTRAKCLSRGFYLCSEVRRLGSTRKREDPGNEVEYFCAAAITLLGCCFFGEFRLVFVVLLVHKVRRSRFPFLTFF